MERLGHLLEPTWSQKHQDGGLKSDLGTSRGSQGVSEGLNGSILGRCSSLVLRYLVFWYIFCKKGFVHHGCSVALQLLFSMCWTWSRQRRRRGRRPHDVHVRCFEVHGTIHMMAAKSTTWSCLKRGWNNDLGFERASRSLAKTGSSWGSFLVSFFGVFFGVCFLECFLGAQRGPKGSPKWSKIDKKEVQKRYLKRVPKKLKK